MHKKQFKQSSFGVGGGESVNPFDPVALIDSFLPDYLATKKIINIGAYCTVVLVCFVDEPHADLIGKFFIGYNTIGDLINIDVSYGFSQYARVDKSTKAYFKKKFLQEASLLSNFDHPNIVRVFSCHLDFAVPFFLMPYVGQNLNSKILSGELRKSKKIFDFIRDLLSVLQCFFDHQIIHRDITPHNILVDQSGGLIVCDLGLSRVLSNSCSSDSHSPRTPYYYFAPEQDIGIANSSFSGDIYSVAVVLFRVYTGFLPRFGLSIDDLLVGSDERLKDFFKIAMSYNCGDRFQTPGEAASFLKISI